MNDDLRERIRQLIDAIPSLTEGQLYWLEKVIKIFNSPHDYRIFQSDLLNTVAMEYFGDALRIHHSFSVEPFSKDKFEYVLEKVLKMSGYEAILSPRGFRGHDIKINGWRVSLKTQADKNIKENKLWISKFMELGRGQWGDDPDDLIRLRDVFLQHLVQYDRILSLRALRREPQWRYELVEIPKDLLESARDGVLEMKTDSTQYPKPGYCYVRTPEGKDIYQLYFDAGGERKLQVKNMDKSYCIIHANWEFVIPQG